MIRFVHFSDLHLGSDYHGKPDPETGINQRIHDFAARFDELIDFTLANEVDLVLFAGDAFKNATPSPTVQEMLARRVKRLANAGVHVFMLAGNHDLPRMVANVTAFSVYPALEVPNVTVAEKAGVYAVTTRNGETIQIAAIPHFWRGALTRHLEMGLSPGDIDKAIEKLIARWIGGLADSLNPSLPAVLTSHVHVTKAKLSTAQDLYGVSDMQVTLSNIAHRAFPYIALGHIHKQQVLNDDWRNGSFAAYSGSLDRVDFGEENETKGFYVVELENGKLLKEPEFIEVAARPFATIKVRPNADDPTATVIKKIEATTIDQAIVRVQIASPRDVYDEVDLTRVRDALDSAYEAKIVHVQPEDSISIGRDLRFAEQMSEAKALQEWVSADEDLAKDSEELLRLGKDLIDEVMAET